MKDDRIKMFFIWAGILLTWLIFVCLIIYGVWTFGGPRAIISLSGMVLIYYIYNLYKIW